MKVIEGYEQLVNVLEEALAQAAEGKGAERHATGQPFLEQPAMVNMKLLGSNQGALFQALKKIQESSRMNSANAKKELLGAINYLAAAIIYLDTEPDIITQGSFDPTTVAPLGGGGGGNI